MTTPNPLHRPLTQLPPGQTAIVRETRLDARDAALLRAMGLRPNATVRICRLGEPCIVEVLSGSGEGGCNGPGGCWCRIGLSKPLALGVVVEQTDSCTGPGCSDDGRGA
ncbi:MAG: FeoA family protein [Phycisphaerales bacterium]